MTEPVRVGVVGAGAIAQVAHLTAVGKLEGAQLVGICDIDVPKAQALGTRFGIRDAYDDIEDLLRYSKPDAVVICTPNHLHEVHVTTALSAGVHVLCERPLALSEAGVERVNHAYAQSDRTLLVGMNNRYRRDVRTIRDFVQGNELGTINSIRSGWYMFRPLGLGAAWRQSPEKSGGGVMLDLGLPLLDLSLWLSGYPPVSRVSASFTLGATVEDTACALIVCESGLSVFVDVTWRHIGPKEKMWFEVMGDEGSAHIGRFGVFKELHGQPVEVTPSPVEPGDAFTGSYREEWREFLRTIRGEVERPGLEDQAVLHRVMDAIRQSAIEGREIVL